MPSKNKPKRLDRNRKFQVARRKAQIEKLKTGGARIRAPRPKHKTNDSLLN
ncbi:MAG: hypothetical protein ACI83O_000515 [Patescibacteria group bacterium]|jgi:hypothetical protein